MGQLPDILQVANGGISALSRGHCDRLSDSQGLHGVWATVYHPDMPAISAVTDRGYVSLGRIHGDTPMPRTHARIGVPAGPLAQGDQHRCRAAWGHRH